MNLGFFTAPTAVQGPELSSHPCRANPETRRSYPLPGRRRDGSLHFTACRVFQFCLLSEVEAITYLMGLEKICSF